MLTLADLVTEFELHAVCIRCERMERLDLQQLLSHVPDTCTVAELRTRVTCRECGLRTYDIRIVYVGINGKARGFHYREHSAKTQSPSSSVPSSVSPNPDTPT